MSVIAERTAAAVEPEPYAGLAALFRGDLSWQDRALCARTDPEAFFPDKGGSAQAAKRICRGCAVQEQCLEYALENDERFGVWGGLTAGERMAASLDRKSRPARSRSRRKAAEREQPKPDEVAICSETPVPAPSVEGEPRELDALDLIEDCLREIPGSADAGSEPALPAAPGPAPAVQAATPAAPARRHRKCGYPIGSIGHEIACGGGK